MKKRRRGLETEAGRDPGGVETAGSRGTAADLDREA